MFANSRSNFNISYCCKFTGNWKGKEIECAWMDEKTALYCKDYLCEYHPEKSGDMKYLGYDIDQWITINLNRNDSMNQYYLNRIREKERKSGNYQGNNNQTCEIF